MIKKNIFCRILCHPKLTLIFIVLLGTFEIMSEVACELSYILNGPTKTGSSKLTKQGLIWPNVAVLQARWRHRKASAPEHCFLPFHAPTWKDSELSSKRSPWWRTQQASDRIKRGVERGRVGWNCNTVCRSSRMGRRVKNLPTETQRHHQLRL